MAGRLSVLCGRPPHTTPRYSLGHPSPSTRLGLLFFFFFNPWNRNLSIYLAKQRRKNIPLDCTVLRGVFLEGRLKSPDWFAGLCFQMRDVGLSFSLSLTTSVKSGRKCSHTVESKVKRISYSCIERPPGSRGFALPVSPSPGYLYPQCAGSSASLTQEHPVPKLYTEKQCFRLKRALSTGVPVHPHLPSFPSIPI